MRVFVVNAVPPDLRHGRTAAGSRLTRFTLAAALTVAVSGCTAASAGSARSTEGSPAPAEKVVTVTYPTIPPVRLPDTSMLGAGGGVLSGELSSLKNADEAGLDIVSPTCDAKGNLAATAPDVFKLTEVADYLNTDGAANVRIKTDKDGTKHYRDYSGSTNLTMTVHKNGSGTLADWSEDKNLNVAVNADGSGTLRDWGGPKNLNIEVNADGSGALRDWGGDRNLTITIPATGGAELTDWGGDRNLKITLASDGSGSYADLGGDRNVELVRGSDGSLRMTDLGGSENLHLTV